MQRFSQRRSVDRDPVIRTTFRREGRVPLTSAKSESTRVDQNSNPASVFQIPDMTEVRGGVYVISVAARILDMHPQTLRKYERLGLVTPTRSVGMLRLYSIEDVVRVKLIKYMVDSLGMNLAGVEFALGLVNRIMNLRERIQAMYQTETLSQILVQELEDMLAEFGAIFPGTPRRA